MKVFFASCRRWGERPACAGRGSERGSATIFVVGFAVVLFAGAGLAIDGGRAINARDKATDIAEQAARAGAGQLDENSLRKVDGTVVLDQAAARARASSFVAATRFVPTTTTTDTSVTVHVSATYRTALLGIIGITSIDVSGNATASPSTGTIGAP